MSETPTPMTPDDDDNFVPEPEKKEPFASKTDVVVVIVLLIAGLAFWFWYQGAGKESSNHFAKADSLYQAHRFPEALAEYRRLRETEKVIAKLDDSLLYRRTDSLSTLEDHAQVLARGARAALASQDTGIQRRALSALTADNSGFVPDSLVQALRKALGAP